MTVLHTDGTRPGDPEGTEPGSSTAVILFTAPGCAVCGDLQPKLISLMQTRFPRLAVRIIDCERAPEEAARYDVRTVPTVVVQFDDKETVRYVRVFSLQQLAESIERPYRLYFSP